LFLPAIGNLTQQGREKERNIYIDMLAGFDKAAQSVAYAFGKDNPKFDAEHFLAMVRGERPLDSRPTRKPVTPFAARQLRDYGTQSKDVELTDRAARMAYTRCKHVPHNPDSAQTVCERCGEEMDLR